VDSVLGKYLKYGEALDGLNVGLAEGLESAPPRPNVRPATQQPTGGSGRARPTGGSTAAGGARAAGQAPNRIYSARELMRRAAEPGPFHNFPESFNQQIFEQGSRTVTPNFWRTAKPGLSNDSVMYQLRGTVNGVEGTFEIGVRPSVSGNTEVIMHRFFRPDP